MRATLRRFRNDRQGTFAVIFAFLMSMVAVGAAFAINAADIINRRSHAQNALDAGVLAAASRADLSEIERTALALKFLDSNGGNTCIEETRSVEFNEQLTTGSYSCKAVTIFSGVLNNKHVTIRVSASAETAQRHPRSCVLVLNGSLPASYEGGGRTPVTADCAVQVNSAHAEAVKFGGESTLHSADNCWVGGSKNPTRATPAPIYPCAPVADPFAARPTPLSGPCDHVKAVFKSETAPVTVEPGTYCGGLQLTGKYPITFNSGIYYIVDGDFKSGVNALVSGNNVVFVFLGNGEVDFTGGCGYEFTAPASGSFQGIIFYGDRNRTKYGHSKLDSNCGRIKYEGVLYFPQQLLDFNSSQGTATPRAPWTVLISDKLYIHGGGTYEFGRDITSSNPAPKEITAFDKSKPWSTRLVR